MLNGKAQRLLRHFISELPKVHQVLEMPQFTLRNRKQSYKSHSLDDFFLHHS